MNIPIRFLALIFLLLLNWKALAQSENVPAERTTVDWTPDTLFFGDLYAGAILLDSFTVFNTGEQPYVIRGVKASCDCTVLRYPTEAVMPGDSATVRVEFDTAGKAGIARPGIIIYDNSVPNSRSIIYLEGYIISNKPKKPLGGN